MEKMIWSKPEMNEFAFAANEYVASCEDKQNRFWKFVCDLSGGFLNRAYDIYLGKYDSTQEKSHLAVRDWNAQNSTLLTEGSWYKACGDTHYVKQEDGKTWENYFELGWADSNSADDLIGNVTETVYIWRGEEGNNVHVTTQLGEDIETVIGNKS